MPARVSKDASLTAAIAIDSQSAARSSPAVAQRLRQGEGQLRGMAEPALMKLACSTTAAGGYCLRFAVLGAKIRPAQAAARSESA